jgi:hypothetical protein
MLGLVLRARGGPPACGFSLATLPSGRALFADPTHASIYDPVADSWEPAPRYRFQHRLSLSSAVVQLAPVPGGALLIDNGLNPFSSAERFQEP